MIKDKVYTCKGNSNDGVSVMNTLDEKMIIVTVGRKEEGIVRGLFIYLTPDDQKEFAFMLINYFNGSVPERTKGVFHCAMEHKDTLEVTSTGNFAGKDYVVLKVRERTCFLSKKQALKLAIRILRHYAEVI